MITASDVLTTCGKHNERLRWVSDAVQENAIETARKVSAMMLMFGSSRTLTSGFRDPESNKSANGAPHSRHMYGQAADIEDGNGDLKRWAKNNRNAFDSIGLWCEPLHMTPTWLHVQTVPTPNKERVPE